MKSRLDSGMSCYRHVHLKSQLSCSFIALVSPQGQIGLQEWNQNDFKATGTLYITIICPDISYRGFALTASMEVISNIWVPRTAFLPRF